MEPSRAASERERFGRERRLRRRADFLRVQREGRRVTSPHFQFVVAPSDLGPDAPARLGLVVNRRVGGAVVRNRVKRLCRECFRRWPDWLPSGVDLVVVSRSAVEGAKLADIQAEWRSVGSAVRRRAEQALAQRPEAPHADRAPRKSPP